MIIDHLDGTRYRVPSLQGLIHAQLKVAPVDNVFDSQNIKNAPGRNRTTSHHGVRKLQLTIMVRAYDAMNTSEIESALARIFDIEGPFYIFNSILTGGYGFELPGQTSWTDSYSLMEYTDMLHKRWFVERINNDAIEWSGLNGKRVIEMETAQLPYSETPYTTQAIGTKTWDENKYAWDMGLHWDDAPPAYTFNTNAFVVKNFSDIAIDPSRRIPLHIELRGVFGSQVLIRNETTGDEFIFSGSLANGDVLVLDGIYATKNGIVVTGSTNKKIIRLAKGENRFTVSGGTVASVKFDFRFYYLL